MRNSVLEPPPPTKWNVINLGAGVQSSTMALMAAHGEITPMPDFAVFADTQAEPKSVYDWLDYLEGKLPFPVYRVTRGNLTDDCLKPYVKKSGTSGVRRLIPAFGVLPDGTKTAAIGRSCTADYKVSVILKKIKQECGITRGQENVTVTQWIGISWDEIQRMKYPSDKWTQHRWPLIEKKMQRHNCLEWMKANGYPMPPRSACVYCPFHSDTEWKRLRDHEPIEFQRAIEFDKKLREIHKNHNPDLKMSVYLHNSCIPLDQIDFDSDEDKGQQVWDFQSECSGMCGV